MVAINRWWWISAAPIQTSGVYIGRRDEEPIAVDSSVYELFGSILPRPSLVYSSPLKRALNTAKNLHQLKECTDDIVLVDGFSEQDFGAWEGQSFGDVQKLIEHTQSVEPSDIAKLKPDNGESFTDVITRTDLAIDTIHYQLAETRSNAPNDVLCVAHISVIRAALAKALGINAEQTLKIHLQPLSLTVLEHHEHFGWFVHATGWTPWPMVK